MKYYTISILLITYFACQEPPVNSFKTTEQIIDYDSIFSDKETPFNTIIDMAVENNILVTQHANDEYNFSFIDIEKGGLIRRWGKAGRGPEEYIEIGSGFTIRESQLVFLDAARKEINYVPLSSLLNPQDSLKIRKEPYPYTVDFRPRHIDLLKEQKIASGFFKNGYFGILDFQNNEIAHTFDYPFPYDDIQGIDRGIAYQTRVRANAFQNKFIVQTLASDVFEIYELTNQGIQRIYTSPFQHVPRIKKQGRRYSLVGNKSIIGLINSAVTDKFIYFSYLEDKYDDVYKNGLSSNEILCFNWNGEKVKKYILPFSIGNFCIEGNNLYGVKYLNEQSVIYRFRL